MNLRPTIEVSSEDLLELTGRATMFGFKRVEPKKRWTDKERRQAACWYINYLVYEALKEKDS